LSRLAGPLRRLIEEEGPISLARYMALALAHPRHGYYATRDPLGAGGDFVTAPEVSQVFGELLGAALAHHWRELGAPARVHLAELGPGRGTLMADLLRVAAAVPGFSEAAVIHLVETSPVLRAVQAERLGGHEPTWHEDVRTLPADAPLLLVANEFLDALPIRQFERTAEGWRERLVALNATGGFVFALGPGISPLDPALRRAWPDATVGSVRELAPAREALASELAERLVAQGGLALLIDYGDVTTRGDTFQAVRGQRRADPLTDPGESDLSSHVDFGALAAAVYRRGATVWGPVAQGAFLARLGIGPRLSRLLARATPAQARELEAGVRRLVHPDEMGELFKVLALSGAAAPIPPGFAVEERRW
jgi:NADH dehydrogenase [ubiquinone] 1 alpha subcomplex assembly factor 7